MSQHIFRSSVELQDSREGGLRTLASLSVRERLARCGSSALSGVEHLRLLVGRDSAVGTLLGHFGSLKELERASFQELRQFLTRREAEAVIAGLSMWSVVDTEEALSGPLDKAEAVYRANLEMRCFRQEVVRVVLLVSGALGRAELLDHQRGRLQRHTGRVACAPTGHISSGDRSRGRRFCPGA
jgi:DNA repair protein RadC